MKKTNLKDADGKTITEGDILTGTNIIGKVTVLWSPFDKNFVVERSIDKELHDYLKDYLSTTGKRVPQHIIGHNPKAKY